MADRILTAKVGGGLSFSESGSDYEGALDVAGLTGGGAMADVDLLPVSQSGSVVKVSKATLSASILSDGRYSASFGNGDLVGGVLSVNHALGEQYVSVRVFDEDDVEVLAGSLTMTDANNCAVDLSGFGTISGTWHVVVRK